MKLPELALDTSSAPSTIAMASIEALNLPLETANERRNGDMSTAIHSNGSMDDDIDNLEVPSDPDAQATVTDFLDFTEYLPSDMIRSLTLIGNLDQTYIDASMNVHELTKTYGELPTLSSNKRPNPSHLRADISQSLYEAVNARTLSHAEAVRMADNVDRHYNRAKNILVKLQAMAEAYPASREASPVHQPGSSPQAVRPPKITLRLDGARSAAVTHQGPRLHRHRAPRITVPGEVLAPYEFDYDTIDSESDDWDSADDEPLTPRQTPARTTGSHAGRIKLVSKRKGTPKMRIPKPPRAPRPPGIMGTNVHSAVAGISTSNALRECTPPPPDVVPGDKKHAPWLELTKYELAKLRKRMKKNAVWSPSDTMILRELKILGRGIEGYRAAKQKAEAAGEPFEYELPTPVYDTSGKKVMAEGAISIDAISRADLNQENRGMKLNQAKKLKRENQAKEAKELAKLAAEEAEESARKMAEAARAMKGLFAKPPSKSATNGNAKGPESPSKTPAKTPQKKRKRESTAETEVIKAEGDGSKPAIKPQKKSKTETPVPAPLATAGSQLSSASVPSVPPTPDELPAEPVLAPATTPNMSIKESSPKKASTPILPPTKENKKDSKKELKRPAAISTTLTRRRTSAAATPTPAPEALPTRRPPSRASSRPTSRGKAASVEPAAVVVAGKSRSRRASTVHNTPAPEVQQPRPSSRRGKRPAPGVITEGMEGSAVSVGERSAATRKKAGLKKQQKDEEKDSTEIWDEIDDEGNIISPTEPRYCLCNRVSFGVMIECEKADVSH
jgi:hypothetical protein